ncbi:hypothetical protein ACEPPN_017321 [Leptodophora sp. 'Broadleaf-Isolate-01']
MLVDCYRLCYDIDVLLGSDASTIQLIYENSLPSSALRTMLIDSVIAARVLDDDADSDVPCFKEYFKELAKALLNTTQPLAHPWERSSSEPLPVRSHPSNEAVSINTLQFDPWFWMV